LDTKTINYAQKDNASSESQNKRTSTTNLKLTRRSFQRRWFALKHIANNSDQEL
jgi:hypothetical protein